MLSRLENSVTGRELNRLWREFEQQYVRALDPATAFIVLDIDGTDRPDARLAAVVEVPWLLRPAHVPSARHLQRRARPVDIGTVACRQCTRVARRSDMLKRIIGAIKQRCPYAAIVVRGDSAFAMPGSWTCSSSSPRSLATSTSCLALRRTARLLELAAPLLAEAKEEYETTKRFVRRFAWLKYSTLKTWSRERDVVLKVEYGERGANPRFLVTTLTGLDPGLIYDRGFCPRGQRENYIKDFKNALAADRLSCHRFAAT